ncbi:hypothetical protein AeMF1_013161 [Aphanomyces euteiches]|nr:hypothetical protein AeMF1_013161 [Aphanomyces euteiches]
MQDEVPIIKTRRRYSLETKRNVLRALSDHTQQRVANLSGIPLRTVQNFVREKEKIWASLHAKRQFHIGEPGRPEILPGDDHLLDYMVAMRKKHFPLITYHVVQQVKANNQEWVNEYSTSKEDPYKSLFRLCRDFVYRHVFSRRRASTAKAMTSAHLLEIRQKFLEEFWPENDHFDDSDVINWSDASISHADKSCRLTAVLAAKRNGDKLPILFVVKGKPGGFIDVNEFMTYPAGHFYAVQKNAWIDGDGWNFYLDTILRPEIVRPSLILIDNFDAHTTPRNVQYVEEELGSTVCTLPPQHDIGSTTFRCRGDGSFQSEIAKSVA